MALTSLPTPPKDLHQSPVRLSACQREVPRGGISRMISWPVRKPSQKPQWVCIHVPGWWIPQQWLGAGLQVGATLGTLHGTDPAVPLLIFLQSGLCVTPPIQRPNWKLTWAEETSVPKRGDKISEKTKHQIHIFDKNYLIMITADFLNSHWWAEFGLGTSALKSYCEARL